MMVVIANPAKKTLTMLSLTRDAWVPLYFTGGGPSTYNKINTAYAYARDPNLYRDRLARYKGASGAGNMAKDTVSEILGIPIDYYFGLDFQGFRDMINAVGGVDVNVPDSFTARYPVNDDPKINAGWTTVHFTKGPQHMDGNRALEYARAREGTDFARSRRQRQILGDFVAQLRSPSGLLHLVPLLGLARQRLSTDYQLPSIGELASLVRDSGKYRVIEGALTSSDYLRAATGPNGTYILLPRAGASQWGQVQAYFRSLLAK